MRVSVTCQEMYKNTNLKGAFYFRVQSELGFEAETFNISVKLNVRDGFCCSEPFSASNAAVYCAPGYGRVCSGVLNVSSLTASIQRSLLRLLHHQDRLLSHARRHPAARYRSATHMRVILSVVSQTAFNASQFRRGCVATDWTAVLLGDQEVGSARPQAGDGMVRFPRRRLSIASPTADGGGDGAAEEGLHLQRLDVSDWMGRI